MWKFTNTTFIGILVFLYCITTSVEVLGCKTLTSGQDMGSSDSITTMMGDDFHNQIKLYVESIRNAIQTKKAEDVSKLLGMEVEKNSRFSTERLRKMIVRSKRNKYRLKCQVLNDEIHQHGGAPRYYEVNIQVVILLGKRPYYELLYVLFDTKSGRLSPLVHVWQSPDTTQKVSFNNFKLPN